MDYVPVECVVKSGTEKGEFTPNSRVIVLQNKKFSYVASADSHWGLISSLRLTSLMRRVEKKLSRVTPNRKFTLLRKVISDLHSDEESNFRPKGRKFLNTRGRKLVHFLLNFRSQNLCRYSGFRLEFTSK
jgi:hypothetical protein